MYKLFYLSDFEWNAIERMSLIVDDNAVQAIQYVVDRDEQHSVVSKFIQHDLDAALEKVTLSHY